MVIVDLHIILGAEPCTVTSELGLWRNVRENGKDNLIWEFEDCKNGVE